MYKNDLNRSDLENSIQIGVGKSGMEQDKLSEAYKNARRAAKKEVRAYQRAGMDPYPHALEDLLENYETYKSKEKFNSSIVPERIIGTYAPGRKFCFSKNFKPLPKENDGDFAAKWQKVYRDVPMWLSSGNRVEVLEFMHDLYVTEGNKRVSVSKYLSIPEIGVRVERIIPRLSNNKPEVDEYHRFLEFERRTGLHWLTFSPGQDFDRIDDIIQGIYGNDSRKYERFMKDIFVPFLHSYLQITGHKPESKFGDVLLDFLDATGDPVGMRSDERKRIIRSELKKKAMKADKRLKLFKR
ncbi:MAG: hypothetical protein ACLFTR_02485 [Candidatus Woesearchaeota archaeon]